MTDSPGFRYTLVGLLGLSCAVLAVGSLADSGLASHPAVALSYLSTGHVVRAVDNGTEFTVDVEHFEFSGTTGNFIDDWVYYVGAYETHVLHFLRDVQPPDGVFLDIGANVGLHSLYMANYAKTVHAIEPWPPVLVRLDAMIAANEATNVVVHRVGYAEEAGSMPYFPPDDGNLGTGSFDADMAKGGGAADELPLVVGDTHLEDIGASTIDLVKIDIEGFERYALNGLRGRLTRDKPVVVLETNATEGGFRSRADLDATFGEGYRYRRLTTPGGHGAWSIRLLGWRWVYGPEEQGDYVLEPFEDDFERRGTLVAVHESRATASETLQQLGFGGPGGGP